MARAARRRPAATARSRGGRTSETEAQLRVQGAALEAAANAIVITDREGRITWANPAFARLTGWTLEECRGQTPRFLKSGVHDSSLYEDLWQTIRSGRVWQGEIVNRRKDGSFYFEEQTITPVRREGDGEITHFVGIKVDVTERRAAREALARSEHRYRTLAAAIHDDVFIVDRNGCVQYVNAAGAEKLGHPPDELSGRRLEELFPAEIAARFRQNIARVLTSGQHIYVEEQATFDDRDAWIGTWLAPLKGAGDEVDSVVGVARDLTVRIRTERALAASEARYRSLFERNLAGVYRATLDGRIVESNDAFARIFGYGSAAEVRGLGIGELYPPGAGRSAFLARLRTEGTILDHESEGRTKDLAPVWVLENASLVREDASGAPCIEGTVVDLTQRRRLERQLTQAQKMEAIGQLAGGLAHDFSNILNVIGGHVGLALKRVDERDPLHRDLNAIAAATARATSLTRQLLRFGRQPIAEPAALDLNEVVRGLGEMLRRLIREDIEMVTRLGATPALVRADRGQMEQLVINLVINARDAMPTGGRLAIETAARELDDAFCREHAGTRPGPHVMLAVSDTGIGMDAETQARIFDPFFTTKGAEGGTGLGLATVDGILKQTGGSIWVESAPGWGAQFKVFLPRLEERAEVETPVPEPGMALAEMPGGTETILLVEDEAALRALTLELLESLGYTVLEARYSAEALETSARYEGTIDLVLTDVVMPGIGGPELAARIAEARPETRVLFVSGYAEDEEIRRRLADAHVGFLQKPFTFEELARELRRLLDGPSKSGAATGAASPPRSS